MTETTLLTRAKDSVFRTFKRPVWTATYRLTGWRLQTPLRFYDMGLYAGTFEADAATAQLRMPSRDFRVVQHEPGRTLVQVEALDYRHVNVLAPYREIAVSVPIDYTRHEGGPARGFAVLHLPVTTEDARWGGVANFGFPKFVADIAIDRRPFGVAVTLIAEGVHVLTLEVDELKTELRAETHPNFTLRDDGRVMECDFVAEGQMGISSSPGGARLVLGSHAIAAGLREMGIELRSRAHAYAPRIGATASVGRVVGELPKGAAVPTTIRGSAWPPVVQRGPV